MPDLSRWGHFDGDPADTDDPDSDVESIPDDEFPRLFVTRHERLFHSHGNNPYPLPADTREQHRLDSLHVALKRLLGDNNYFGPVDDVLQASSGRRRGQKKALDLCTGNGRWVEEMATEFPHVKFFGVDLVPITTRYPVGDVQFEVHDITTGLRWGDGFFHLVHLRRAALGIRDYPRLIGEIHRVLCHDGLFLSGEWIRSVFMDDNTNTAVQAPRAHAFWACLSQILSMRGIHHDAPRIPEYLRNAGFRDITVVSHEIVFNRPMQDRTQAEISCLVREAHVLFVQSLAPLFLDAGIHRAQVDLMVEGCLHDLQHVPGLKMVYNTVHARKA